MKDLTDQAKQLIKSESGLFVSPETVTQNTILNNYNKRYLGALNAPTPNVKVAYSYILTKAVPPKMVGTTESGLIINEIQADKRMLKKLEIMTDNVSDEQEVLAVGIHAQDVVNVGDTIKIDFRRYKTLNDDHTPGVIETSYEIPLYEIEGNEYLILDARDIIYIIPKKDETTK